MSRLVVNPGTPQAWEIHLKPGANSLGRGDSNDFKINDPSVSGSHCQILVGEGPAVLKDAGSTNGTFVGGAQIREQRLENGQTVRLGGVPMIYYSDSAPAVRPVVRVGKPATPAVASPVALAVATPAAPLIASPAAEETTLMENPAAQPPPILTGTSFCKHHIHARARHFCPTCNLTFCDACVNTSGVGENVARTCRKCGTPVLPFQFQAPPAKSFFESLPGAFGYPFKGAGIIIVVFATIAFAALNFISGGFLGFFIKVALYGFVFLFMQNIILTTTSDETAELCFPDPGSLLGAALQFGGTVVASFWLALGLEIAKIEDVAVPSEAIIAAFILGGIYFPMALLAVAMKETVLAANPLIVIPAMVKVPSKYAVTVALALTVFGIRQLGSILSSGAGMLALRTHDVHRFLLLAGFQMMWALLSVYLLTVTMRILGLFYNSSKRQLGWYSS